MSVTDELLKHNEGYAARFDKDDLAMPPGIRSLATGELGEVA